MIHVKNGYLLPFTQVAPEILKDSDDQSAGEDDRDPKRHAAENAEAALLGGDFAGDAFGVLGRQPDLALGERVGGAFLLS